MGNAVYYTPNLAEPVAGNRIYTLVIYSDIPAGLPGFGEHDIAALFGPGVCGFPHVHTDVPGQQVTEAMVNAPATVTETCTMLAGLVLSLGYPVRAAHVVYDEPDVCCDIAVQFITASAAVEPFEIGRP